MDEAAIDVKVMGRLAKALAFVCGPEHPAAVALRTAAETGAAADVKKARTQFLRLKPGERRAALGMIED